MNCLIDTSTLRRRLYRTIAGVAFTVASGAAMAPVAVQACDCGCEIGACDSMGGDGVSCGCETHRQSAKKPRFDMRKTPVYKTLDLLAGGIEKALKLDQDSKCGCDDAFESCDDACDATMLMELSSPLPSLPTPAPQPTHLHAHPAPARALPSAPVPAPANRVIQPTPSRPPMPRVAAPVIPAEPQTSRPLQAEPGLVPAPIESPAADAPGMGSFTPAEAGGPRGLRRISRPNEDSTNDAIDSSPNLPAPIIDRGRTPFQNEPNPAELDESVDPFLDDPFQSTPLGRRSVGSGLRPVQYQHAQPNASRANTSRTAFQHRIRQQPNKPPTRRTSRNPKSNRGGMFR